MEGGIIQRQQDVEKAMNTGEAACDAGLNCECYTAIVK